MSTKKNTRHVDEYFFREMCFLCSGTSKRIDFD